MHVYNLNEARNLKKRHLILARRFVFLLLIAWQTLKYRAIFPLPQVTILKLCMALPYCIPPTFLLVPVMNKYSSPNGIALSN